MTKPIRPTEIATGKLEHFPPVVIEAFNAEIAANYSHGSATVYHEAVVKRLVALGNTRSDIFDNGWLNVEEIYAEAGWTVEHDKPGFNESYDAFFVFRKKKEGVNGDDTYFKS